MDRKIRVAAVDYLNTKPLIWGFEKGMMQEQIDLQLDYPAKIANDLLNDRIDVGLVPVAVLPILNPYYIISDFCIGSNDHVASVCVFSDVPIEDVKSIYLDYQSRTSVALLKILLRDFWKVSPDLLEASPGYENNISGNVAALIIGDRALACRKHSPYIYDLGYAWKQMTGLPFVYAAWVANKELSSRFVSAFNDTTGKGLDHISEIVRDNPFALYNLYEYYTKNIDYNLDEQKTKGLELFLSLITDSSKDQSV